MNSERTLEPYGKRLTALHAAAERIEVVVHISAEIAFASRHDDENGLPVFRQA